MATRFTVTDHATASRAAVELPTYARTLAAITTEAAEALAALPAAADPQRCLDGLVVFRAGQAKVRRAENAVLLRLHEAGASPTGLATALGINRLTVDRRLAAARAERDSD
ncbi:hypothetical protein PP568_07085 [Mycobacteroides abscessus]|uniref:Fis family transcriptional regulator n=1 Tax=Mycobacteroides abscessus subsp. abscessus TaxID=1185650 RepID=A0AB38D2G6_9MYCO|nr:hypothetical protein [Mycobacteroides abscessus]MBE5419619.1 hypothetical protein [Mycobacteroides abscessus]MBE5455681.1 hypothetical protein [Mycobacteroides abscessus]MBN7459194.1 hypothetical protein [Mycobacteroides abscessus subsp. abscessus]MBN7555301.1 hypothetical protein [Mycobacteroides abscessus subsp. abscessus]MDM2404696.1 hypothetical protein [Mycobacteroides abscessus]